MLRIHKASEMIGRHVYTSEGDYFGQIEEVNVMENRIDGWKIKIGGSFISVLGGARGVIIPHQFVKAVGDIFIVNRGSLPSKSTGESMDLAAGAEQGSMGQEGHSF